MESDVEDWETFFGKINYSQKQVDLDEPNVQPGDIKTLSERSFDIAICQFPTALNCSVTGFRIWIKCAYRLNALSQVYDMQFLNPCPEISVYYTIPCLKKWKHEYNMVSKDRFMLKPNSRFRTENITNVFWMHTVLRFATPEDAAFWKLTQ